MLRLTSLGTLQWQTLEGIEVLRVAGSVESVRFDGVMPCAKRVVPLEWSRFWWLCAETNAKEKGKQLWPRSLSN